MAPKAVDDSSVGGCRGCEAHLLLEDEQDEGGEAESHGVIMPMTVYLEA